MSDQPFDTLAGGAMGTAAVAGGILPFTGLDERWWWYVAVAVALVLVGAVVLRLVGRRRRRDRAAEAAN